MFSLDDTRWTIDEQACVIRDAGYRLTRSRLAVLQALAETDVWLDAAAVLELGRQFHPRLGQVSVYRTLELLTKLGLARRVHSKNGCHSYGRAGQGEGHFLICTQCGQLTEFACEGLDELIRSVGQRSGFSIRGHLLQLEGICTDCQPVAR